MMAKEKKEKKFLGANIPIELYEYLEDKAKREYKSTITQVLVDIIVKEKENDRKRTIG